MKTIWMAFLALFLFTGTASAAGRLLIFKRTLPHDRRDSHDTAGAGNRLLLVAREETGAETIPFEEARTLGFEVPSELTGGFSPLFLLTANGHGVSDIRSFTLVSDNKKGGLPDRLLNHQKLMRKKFGTGERTLKLDLAKITTNLTLMKLLAFWRSLSGFVETAQHFDAFTAVGVFDRMLTNPEAVVGRQLLTDLQIKTMAALLSIRFADRGEISGYFGSEEALEQHYDLILGKKLDNASMRFGRLITESNLQGDLKVEPVGRDFVLVSRRTETGTKILRLVDINNSKLPETFLDFEPEKPVWGDKVRRRQWLRFTAETLAGTFTASKELSRYLDGLEMFGERELWTARFPTVQKRWQDLKTWLSNEKEVRELGEHLDREELKTCNKIREVEYRKAQREPAGEASASSVKERPVIVFMVDSLRPDRVHYFGGRANTPIPIIKRLFLDEGVEVPSFNTHATSTPSWSTILSGFDPSENMVRTSGSSSHDKSVKVVSYLDPRPDMKIFLFGSQVNRPLKRIRLMGFDWVRGALLDKESVSPFMLLHDGIELPIYSDKLNTLARALLGVQMQTFNDGEVWDIANSRRIARYIKADRRKKKLKLVLSYLGAVDHDAHRANHNLNQAFRSMDEQIGLVLKEAKAHPTLKDAVILLISDHGMSGGVEYPNPEHFLTPDADIPYFVKNTEFNLTKFFAGDYVKAKEPFFVVGSVGPTSPTEGSSSMISAPTSYNYYGNGRAEPVSEKNLKERDLLVAQSGNGYAPIYFLDNADPKVRKSYYELRHHKTFDIPESLLGYQLKSTTLLYQREEQKKLGLGERFRKITGNRPIGLLTMALQGEAARRSADALAGASQDGLISNDEPILIQARGAGDTTRSALILTHRDGETAKHRYVIVRGFDQAADGMVSGTVTTEVSEDPLWIPVTGRVSRGSHPNDVWLTDIEWLKRTKNEWHPNALAFLIHNFLLSPSARRHQDVQAFEAETPDMILFSAYGFNFNQSEDNQGDHGGLHFDSSRTSFFIHDPLKRGKSTEIPSMTRDIVPTILDYLGVQDPYPQRKGTSVRSRLFN